MPVALSPPSPSQTESTSLPPALAYEPTDIGSVWVVSKLSGATAINLRTASGNFLACDRFGVVSRFTRRRRCLEVARTSLLTVAWTGLPSGFGRVREPRSPGEFYPAYPRVQSLRSRDHVSSTGRACATSVSRADRPDHADSSAMELSFLSPRPPMGPSRSGVIPPRSASMSPSDARSRLASGRRRESRRRREALRARLGQVFAGRNLTRSPSTKRDRRGVPARASSAKIRSAR